MDSNEFKSSITKPTEDWYNLLSEEQKQLIEKSRKEHRNGETISDVEARKQIREFTLSNKS